MKARKLEGSFAVVLVSPTEVFLLVQTSRSIVGSKEGDIYLRRVEFEFHVCTYNATTYNDLAVESE